MGLDRSATGSGAVFDPRTSISSAWASQTGSGRLELLPGLIDPRGWVRSPFWLAARPVERKNGRFVPRLDLAPLGTPWKGPMFEYVVFNDEGCTVSGFQVILNVDFRVPRSEDGSILGISLGFSLLEPLGNIQLMRVASGGVEIDSGGSAAVIHPGGSSRANDPDALRTVTLTFTKSVRFSNILSRSTPGQGDARAGSALNTNAPAMLAVWMQDLVQGTMETWAQWSGCGGAG
jgi:hypothetical protein